MRYPIPPTSSKIFLELNYPGALIQECHYDHNFDDTPASTSVTEEMRFSHDQNGNPQVRFRRQAVYNPRDSPYQRDTGYFSSSEDERYGDWYSPRRDQNTDDNFAYSSPEWAD